MTGKALRKGDVAGGLAVEQPQYQPPAARKPRRKEAFTRRQYAIAVDGLRREGIPLDALPIARIAERALDWMDRHQMMPREKPSLASGKRHLPDILGRGG
jgi:hypothetical protein